MSYSSTTRFIVALVVLLPVGCVNLDKRDPAPFRFGQKTKDGQTVATAGDTKKSIAKMQNMAKPTGFASKVKKAWPFQRKTRMTVAEHPLAQDDPTRLDNMPSNVGPELYVSAARMAEKSGNLTKAFEQYNVALKKDGRHRNALIGLARLQHRTGKTDDAIRIYRNALDIHRNDAVIMNDLGICYARKGQSNQAISMLQAATKAAPEREMYVNNLAAALVEVNRTGEAVAHLSRIRGPAVANYNVGYLLDKSGRKDEAAAFLGQALEIDPDLKQARALLSEYAPKMSSLPQDLPKQGRYEIPVSKTELNAPENFGPPAANLKPASFPSTNAPPYLKNRTERSGPFGYIPTADSGAVRVVSYVEDIRK